MIHLLTPSAYAGELPRPGRVGRNGIFRAKININDEQYECFVKPLPDKIFVGKHEVENRELISEALGYVLAAICNFDVPGMAGAIGLHREMIPTEALEALDRITAGERKSGYLAWFSEDMRQQDLVWRYAGAPVDAEMDPGLADRLWRRISQALVEHKRLPELVTFDEWLQNADRHPGNLLHSPVKGLSLIDHGRLFHHESWHPHGLHTRPLFARNKVIECVRATEPDWHERLPVRKSREKAYGEIGHRFRQNGRSAAERVLNSLGLSHQEIIQVLDFISARLEPDHIRKATGTDALL